MLYSEIDVKSIAEISIKIVEMEESRILKTGFFLITKSTTPKKTDRKVIKIPIIWIKA